MDSNPPAPQTRRPNRPCDACRKRKSRCEIQENETSCVLCKFHRQVCLFNENPQPRKRKKVTSEAVSVGDTGSTGSRENALALSDHGVDSDRRFDLPILRHDPSSVHDYANLKGPSLLKATLGLQYHQHSKILGLTSEFDSMLLNYQQPGPRGDIHLGPQTLRKVSHDAAFLLVPDATTQFHNQEILDLDAIEALVAPHGLELINLYFRIVHPSFPILHKRVFLEKYRRSHREFAPPLLAAVYLLAISWWPYSATLAALDKPDEQALVTLAQRSMAYVVARPKLSTIQAGLLLLQQRRPPAGAAVAAAAMAAAAAAAGGGVAAAAVGGPAAAAGGIGPGGVGATDASSWSLTGQLVALAQEVGLNYDCTQWTAVPSWERGLRKRLAWALWMQDKWGALEFGRPSHITGDDWRVRPVAEADFPERSQDEDDEEGSAEVEKGRVLFSEMIKLTVVLARILSEFYTLKAQEEFIERQAEGGRWVLERAKGIQLALKDWFSGLPDSMKMEDVKMRKLSSTGYLHLAYYATEITLHRRIVTSLQHEEDYSLVQICRSAALSRLNIALEFVKQLRPEHIQSFWYSASKYNFVLLGTFIGLLWATSTSNEEQQQLREKFEEYRWTLRLSSKSSEILDRAANSLTTSIGTLLKAIPGSDQIHLQMGITAASYHEDSPGNQWSIEQPNATELQQSSPTSFSDGPEIFWQGLNISQSYDLSGTEYIDQDGIVRSYT